MMNTTAEAEAKKTIAENSKEEIILFVCTGNTCRSPMAQALFNHLYAKGKVSRRAESAGLFAYGQPISANAKSALEKAGISNFRHYSVNINPGMLEKASLIVGMTRSHASRLMMEYPEFASKITTFKEDISDPFGGSPEDYENCLSDILRALAEMFGEPNGNN